MDAVYESNGATNLSGDVLSKLMGVGAMGGIRKRQTDDKKRLAYVVLESTNKHADWLDYVDYESGIKTNTEVETWLKTTFNTNSN